MSESYLKTINNYVPLTRKEEQEFFRKARKGDRKAYETIIKSNLRFVVSIAKTYVGRGLDLEDLIAEGNVGLLKAFNNFDIDRNYKFITYAVWWIRQSILFAIQEYSKTIRLPANQINDINKAIKKKFKLEQEEGRNIPLNSLGDYTDNPVILNGAKQGISIVNLEDELTSDGYCLKDTIPANTGPDITELNSIFLEELALIIKDFPKREQEIIHYYYGIGNTKKYTLTEIGEKIGLTRERIRQIKMNTLKKIRNHGNINLLT